MSALTEIHWSAQSGLPLLALLQILPAAAALVMVALRKASVVRAVALAAALAELALAVQLWRAYDSAAGGMQLAERLTLLGPLGYHAAADGIGVLFIGLTAFLSLMVVCYGLMRRFEPEWRFLALVLGAEAAMMSQFATADLMWFVAASAVQVALAGLLLKGWATSPEEGGALGRFWQFMGTGLVLLLAGASLFGWLHADTRGWWSFDLFDLAGMAVPAAFGSALFYLLFYGLAIRIPLFPLHGWLPAAAEHGTVAPGLVLLLGLKTGVFGLLRFVLPLLPEAVWQWHYFVVAFAAAGIFYAALLALMQENLRRLLAYAVVSHTSVLVIGLFSLHPQAFQGSAILAVNYGLAGAALLFMTGFVYRRTHTVLLSRLGGLWDHMPMIGVSFLVAGLAIIGMPGTPGFDAVHLMLEAAIVRFGALLTIAAALGNVAAAGFLLWAFQRAFLAPPAPGAVTEGGVARATPAEIAIAVTMIVVQLLAGFFSQPFFDLVERDAQRLAAPFQALAGRDEGKWAEVSP